ncbi:MFS transporter [Flexivirga meconopsidis]|uniref:MFS transporter n=1 Tax=Flexivirga meconopsidis TaxID=2977121 RepID=UPI00223E9A2B|nr:MFS transporter [Flexivirga meconopsidis]
MTTTEPEPTAAPAARPAIPREVWVMVCASFVIALGYGVVAPALPEFARSFDVGVTAASAVVSAFAVMRLVFAPTSGRLVRKLGEQPVYLLGLLIVALSTLAAAFSQNYWQLIVFRGLGGIGSVMFTVSAMGLIIRIAPPAIRGRVSGLYSSSFVLGSISGPLLGGALVGFGLRVPFVVYAVALLVAIAVVRWQLRGSPLTAIDTSPTVAAMPMRAALAIGAYRSAVLTAMIFGWVYAMRVSLVPLYFAIVLHQQPGVAGLALATYACGDVLAMFPSGRLSDRVGRRPLIVAGMTVLALATAALALTESVPLAFAFTLVAGVGTGMVSPAQQAALADIMYGHGRGGPVLVTFQMCQDVGTVVGPVVGGFLAQMWGFPVAFGVTAALAAVAALAWAVVRDTTSATVGS